MSLGKDLLQGIDELFKVVTYLVLNLAALMLLVFALFRLVEPEVSRALRRLRRGSLPRPRKRNP